MSRATPEEAREQLLAAGERLMERHFGGNVPDAWRYLLRRITAGAVAAEAGYRSRTAIYREWGRDGDDAGVSEEGVFERYLHDLLVSMDPGGYGTPEGWAEVMLEVIESGATVGEVMAAGAGELWEWFVRDPGEPAGIVAADVLLLSLASDPEWAPVRDHIEQLHRDGLGASYELFGELIGVRPAPPLTWDDIRMIGSAVVDGCVFALETGVLAADERWPSPFEGEEGEELYPIQIISRAVIGPISRGERADRPGAG